MSRRKILFLQGPASPFLRFVADRAEDSGAKINKINVCLGDAIFWRRRGADWFTGRFEDWPAFLDAYVTREGISDMVMLGDGRRLHSAAIDVAFRHNIRVHILEHGYIRPDWLTLEPDGMSGYSRFPRDPDAIRALAANHRDLDVPPRYKSPPLLYELYDLAFHLPNVFLGWLVHPHYRTHGPVHPLVEYSGVVWKALIARRRKKETTVRLAPYLAPDGPPYFLFPLQLPGDYQIRIHAPGGALLPLVEGTIRSFADNAPAGTHLLFKVHPIDNGLLDWPATLAAMATRYGVSDRLTVVDGGSLDAMLARAKGVVTVNSTVGIAALQAGVPVTALGAAIYDIDGLTHQGSLSQFWKTPEKPDPDLVRDFVRALVATTQLRGGFIGRQAIEDGSRNVAARIMEETERLPLSARKPRTNPQFRYERELLGEP